jgi:hypothetical protein
LNKAVLGPCPILGFGISGGEPSLTSNTRGYSTAGIVKQPSQFSHKLILDVNIYWVIPVPYLLLVMMMMMRITFIIIISLNPVSDLGKSMESQFT